MDEEQLNPDNAEHSPPQDALLGGISVKMDASSIPPTPKKPNHVAEMVQGIFVTLLWYLGVYFASVLVVTGISGGYFLIGVFVGLVFAWPICALVSIVLILVFLWKGKFYNSLGVLMVTGVSLLLTGAFCANEWMMFAHPR